MGELQRMQYLFSRRNHMHWSTHRGLLGLAAIYYQYAVAQCVAKN